MKWNETVADTCRYGDVAGKVFGDFDILWEDSECDYQGHATILGKKGKTYVFYEWWYGSCSGCDDWESRNLTDDEIAAEMQETAMFFEGKRPLKKWLGMLEGTYPVSRQYDTGGLTGMLDLLGGGTLGRINAIRSALGMPPVVPKAE
jgi:hypothetical protein